MSRKVKTEHAGAKKAQGYWGCKEEAKRISRKKRREEAREILVRDIKEFKGKLRFRRDTATSRHHPRGESASSSIVREVFGVLKDGLPTDKYIRQLRGRVDK